jgi:hypothetical protein
MTAGQLHAQPKLGPAQPLKIVASLRQENRALEMVYRTLGMAFFPFDVAQRLLADAEWARTRPRVPKETCGDIASFLQSTDSLEEGSSACFDRNVASKDSAGAL